MRRLAMILAAWLVFRRRWALVARLLGLPAPRAAVDSQHNLQLSMPDGVQLATDRYYPRGAAAGPTILVRGYVGRRLGWQPGPWLLRWFGQLMAGQGYHVVVQTMRGRADSGGDFTPWHTEAQDGRATLDWIVAQPWSDGRVGMYGPSYLGYAVWAAAAEAPPELRAIVPCITGARFYGPFAPEGGLNLDGIFQGLLLFGLEAPERRGEQRLSDVLRLPAQQRRLARALAHLPLHEADEVAFGRTIPFFQEWLAAAPDSAYWRAIDLRPALAHVTAPAHLLSGWHDFFLPEVLADYAALRAAGQSPYLTVGPWSHYSLGHIVASLQAALAWFAAHLQGVPAALQPAPVRIYAQGAGWLDLPAWPPPTTALSYALHAGGHLRQSPAGSGAPTTFEYDPMRPTPALGGPLFSPLAAGQHDNRPLAARPDVVHFSSEPLLAPLTLVGSVEAALFVSCSTPWFDVFARLCSAAPDGRLLNICDGLARVTPSGHAPAPDGSVRVALALTPTAYQIPAGHRLVLLVAGGAHPRWNRNLGTGEPAATATRWVIAQHTLHHDAEHPATVTLPVLGATR